MYVLSEKRRLMSSAGVTKKAVYKRSLLPEDSARAGYHLLYLTRNIRVRQGKHTHLHKYAVKHTLVAPGCGDGGESEASPASQLASH